jgi:DNA-binding transcriptional ArsR family regulator
VKRGAGDFASGILQALTVLHAIAEPHRREILRLVRDAELSSGDIAAHFDVTRPAISQHLQVLVAAGLVSMRRQGS